MSQVPTHVLAGMKVLDLTRALAGPSCTRMFAEMGAEVIKVEPGPTGDMTRNYSKRNDRSLYYIQQNLNKKSVCLDFRKPGALDLVRGIVPHVDVVVENYRPGVMADMGLAYEDLRKLREDIILCSISALGQSGPLASKPGYDYIAQAYSGVTSMVGDPEDAPYIPLVGLGDVNTGVTAALGVLAALRHRDQTGEGQHVDVGLLDVYFHCHEVNVHQYSGSGGEVKPTRTGRHVTYLAPAGVFRGTGGCVVIMAFQNHWKDLCAAMERPDLLDHELFGDDATRVENKEKLVPVIEDWLQGFPDIDTPVRRMEDHGVPCAPVLSVAEAVNHPHLRARGTVRTVSDPIAGEFEIPGHPIRFSGFPDDPRYRAPRLGEHGRAILSEWLGKSGAEIDELLQDGVVIEGDT